MTGLLVAIGFLTRVQVPSRVFAADRAQPRSLPWYPLVGALIGAALALLAWLLPHGAPLLSAALLVVVWAGLTGGLHLDGLADSADAWVGGMASDAATSRARTLEIMKDPRCGPAGVVALVLVLLLKFAALATLLGVDAAAPALRFRAVPAVTALLLAPLLARASLTAAMLWLPYVRKGGIGAGLPFASRSACALALALTVCACTLPAIVDHAWPIAGLLALTATLVVGLLWARACLLRLGGITGDTCGALAELVEAAVLVALACFAV